MTDYLTTESQITPYMAFPRFLLELDLPETAKILYVLLLDRARMSLKNQGWMDEDGHLFIYYSVFDLMRDLKKSETSVKNSLRVLEKAGLIVRQRSKPGVTSRTYLKVWPRPNSFLSYGQTEKNLTEGQKSISQTGRNLSMHTNYISKPYNQRTQNSRSNRYPSRQRTYECGEGESL